MSLSMLGSENVQGAWTAPWFSKWRLVLSVFGIARRGENIDPRQEVYQERARRIAEVLQKKDNMVITLISEQKSGNEQGYKNSAPHATGAEHHAHAGALLTS